MWGPLASAASCPSGTQGNAPRQRLTPARGGVGLSTQQGLPHALPPRWHAHTRADVPARALRAPHAGAARLAAETPGMMPPRAAVRCRNTLRLAPPQRRARVRWAPPASPTAKAAHHTRTHVWKRVQGTGVAAAGEGRGVARVSGEARQVVACRPTLDCSSASAKLRDSSSCQLEGIVAGPRQGRRPPPPRGGC